ncbi:MAG: hypothetical protein J6X55_10855 [Victivallales bacterium]|nr:hypothetical protein [Victivallales bacterium]
MKTLLYHFMALLIIGFCEGCCMTKDTCQGVGGVATYGHVEKVSNLELVNGTFQLFRKGAPFYRIGFGKEETAWDRSKALNYSNRLEIAYGEEREGAPCLVVYGGKPRKGTDTAWQFETKQIPFEGQPGRFALDMKSCADYLITSIGGEGYNSSIIWYDAEGKEVARFPIVYAITSSEFSNSRTVGVIPNEAKSFSIKLGFDYPNVDPGHFVAFKEIVLSRLDDDADFEEGDAWFDTMMYHVDNQKIAWMADCPGKSSVAVQISEADDVDGKPGEWSAFHGPDGTDGSYYTSAFSAAKPWAKLRVFLNAKGKNAPSLKSLVFLNMDGKNAPSLKSLSDKDRVVNKWLWFVYMYPPLIENITVSPTRNPREEIVLRISSTIPVKWNTFNAKVDGEDATARFVRRGDCFIGSTDKDYAEGLHKIEVSIEDINGGKGEGVKYLMIGDNPANVPHVTLRDDGITLVDGKPFFPIGAYAVWKREFNNFDFDKAFKDLSEAGFNFAHSYNGGGEYPKFLDTAHKYGVRIWSSAYSIQSKDFLEKRLNHPAIIAWYIGDDTSDNTKPNQLQDRHDALKSIDDHRITTQADHVGAAKASSDYSGYVRGSDNFLPEIYPIRVDTDEDRATCVPKVIRDMDTCKADVERCGIYHPASVWPIIQYFQGWTGWKRFPEEHEIRAMSFASIIHGATGITWYTYGGYHDPKKNTTNYGMTSTPERWRVITTITRQLRELEPVLVERTPADQPKPVVISGAKLDAYGNPSITCLLKRHEGETYILAVNSTLDTVEAGIPVPAVNGGTVMFEDRAASITDGVLTDTFKPYDVHIFKLK